jgi:exonuclease III
MVEYDLFRIVGIYVPNSQHKLMRLKYRVDGWDHSLQEYLKTL